MKKRYLYFLEFIGLCIVFFFVGMKVSQAIAGGRNTDGILDTIFNGIAFALYFIEIYLITVSLTSFVLYFIGRGKKNVEMKKAFGFTSIVIILIWVYVIVRNIILLRQV